MIGMTVMTDTGVFAPDVAGWGRVSLAELNTRAPLLDRLENKYVVSAAALGGIMDALRGDFDVLAIDGETTFAYETVYYDTDSLLAYHQHARGKRRRYKIRCRRYVDSDLYFFEVKLKGNRGRTIKQRIPYDDTRHGQDILDEATTAFVQRCVEDTYGEVFSEHLSAQLMMRFRRLTLVGKDRPERLTVDFGLEFVGAGGAEAWAPPETLVIEVKSQNGRGVGDGVLRSSGARGGTCSKYCVGLNLVRPGMRHNVFKQLLRTHFDWAPRPGAAQLPAKSRSTSTFEVSKATTPPPTRPRREFRRFPREEAVFDVFVQDAACVLAGAQRLQTMLEDDADTGRAYEELSALKQEGDQLSRDLRGTVDRSLVTPFGRGETLSLISGLDDIRDLINEVAESIVLFPAASPNEPARTQVATVVAQCRLLHDGLLRLQGFKGLNGHTCEIHRLEAEGNEIGRHAIADLISNGIDRDEPAKRKAIYDLLGRCLDACDHVAKILDRIVVRNRVI